MIGAIRCSRLVLLAAMMTAPTMSMAYAETPPPFRFENVTSAWGLAQPLRGIKAHAMACGDIDNDGDLDIYIGTFCDRPEEVPAGITAPPPNRLLLNRGGRFVLAGDTLPPVAMRTSGAVFADLDNDGDLDLYITNNANGTADFSGPNRLYENTGGKFRDISQGNSACIVMGGRSVGVFDYNGDGLLDLLVLEDYWRGGHSRLFRNTGRLTFQDVTAETGLEMITDSVRGVGLRGLGIVTADLNADGWPDLFISESNQMLFNESGRRFVPVDSRVFASKLQPRQGHYVAGVACRDLDNDGDLDLVTVDHCDESGVYVYMQLTSKDGTPQFVDVTEACGLAGKLKPKTAAGLYLRHDHVELADFDNDGRREIFLANTYPAGDGRAPFVCRNLGGRDADLRFEPPPRDEADAHYPAGAVADYDGDGRLDIFLASWFTEVDSALLLNRTPTSNHWLQVAVEGKSINRMGIGCKIRVFREGQLGNMSALLGYDEIDIGQGYCTGHPAVCHFGLGAAARCDVEVELPFGKGRIVARAIRADQRITLKQP